MAVLTDLLEKLLSEKVVKEVAHQTYFVLVALESDHLYRWAALLLFAVGILSYLVHHFGKKEAPKRAEKTDEPNS